MRGLLVGATTSLAFIVGVVGVSAAHAEGPRGHRARSLGRLPDDHRPPGARRRAARGVADGRWRRPADVVVLTGSVGPIRGNRHKERRALRGGRVTT